MTRGSKTIIAKEPPWISRQLKSLIHERQTALARGDKHCFGRFRNRVNHLRKSKVKHLRDCEPRRWWKEVKLLGGMQLATRTDPTSVLEHIDSGPVSSSADLANVINNAFLAPVNIFTPLDPGISVFAKHTDTPIVTEFCVLKKLIALNPAKASGPDGVPAYPVYDVNKHLRPISLTIVLSKLAEDFVVDHYVKPAIIAEVDPRQFGTVPSSSTAEALVSMTHAWYSGTDGNGAAVRVILFDFKKAFDLIDHKILVRKLGTYSIPDAVISWISEFLTSRKQRFKLGHDCFSEWGAVPAGVNQGTKLGPWLFIIIKIKINELDVPGTDLWKYVDDITISATISENQASHLQAAVDILASRATVDRFQLNETKCKELLVNFNVKNPLSILLLLMACL
ncbi:uncharacterized protein LOC122962934 [Acropora millepora]|uniref:uncharacterized protein LOC122962934 n=1 Tax=Acropora millepora TaxID=45264 RepID=UPI001CF2DBE6|nr:uncharacterized protein LOC122962934 [Acropora millepora]